MPVKRKVKKAIGEFTDGSVVAKPTKRKSARIQKERKAPRPYKMPPPLPIGTVLESRSDKSKWITGQSIGKGGFGEIYLAAPSGKSATEKDARCVVKMEPQDNGPLFTEQSFYMRVGKPELIKSWISSHELSYLGVPKLVAFGFHECKKTNCRFLVLERFGDDVEKLFHQAGKKFGIKTVCHLALRLIEALEYLHSSEYVHADIKGSNLLTGFSSADRHKVYLVDYGLATRYLMSDKHREYKEDRKKCHDGTIEFTSTDAHSGVSPSRRGDMEILGYCLLHWASGYLPWEKFLSNKDGVANAKQSYKKNLKALLEDCFPTSEAPTCLRKYMETVGILEYKEKPNYSLLKGLFLAELEKHGLKDDGKGLDWLAGSPLPSKRKRPASQELPEKEIASPPKKPKRSPAKKSLPSSKRAKPSPSGRRKKVAARSTSPEKSPLQKKVKALANGEVSMDISPPKKPTAKKSRPPGGKLVRKSKPSSSGRARQLAGDDEPDCNPAKLHIPQVVYPPELGYAGPVCLEKRNPPGRSKVPKCRPRKRALGRKHEDPIIID